MEIHSSPSGAPHSLVPSFIHAIARKQPRRRKFRPGVVSPGEHEYYSEETPPRSVENACLFACVLLSPVECKHESAVAVRCGIYLDLVVVLVVVVVVVVVVVGAEFASTACLLVLSPWCVIRALPVLLHTCRNFKTDYSRRINWSSAEMLQQVREDGGGGWVKCRGARGGEGGRGSDAPARSHLRSVPAKITITGCTSSLCHRLRSKVKR